MRFRGRRLGFAACAALLLAAGCRHAGAVSPAQDGQDAAVYRVVLATAGSRLVVRTTVAPSAEMRMGTPEERIAMHARDLPGLDPSTVRSFLERNRQSVPLPDLGDAAVELVSREEWSAHMASREPRWGRGVMMLSRIGYSHDGTQALVYVVKACPLCGGADYVLLSRTGEGWAVVGEANDWNS